MADTQSYIAFLRGINVGGHIIKMDQLREFFSDLSLRNVRSYIQTGNIFFESEKNKEELQVEIEKYLESQLKYPVPTCLRTIDELEEIMKLNPFNDINLTADTRFAVTFLSRPVKKSITLPHATADGAYELIQMTNNELFVVWHLKNGRPGNSYGSLEKTLGSTGTTRFWHTTEKILEAAKKTS